VQEFVSLMEMPAVPEGGIVINAEVRAIDEHARRCNKPEGLQEVNVIVDDDAGKSTGRDAHIRTRDGAIHQVAQRNHALDPLHDAFSGG
jgi:hypothetical protein